MIRKIVAILVVVLGILLLYLLFMPVAVDPQSWQSPPNPGYKGDFAVNERLKGLETFPIGDTYGPEDIALDKLGRIYAATHNGTIVRLQPDGSNPEAWAQTGGRPLGIDFDGNGNLIVADAFQGLLSITPEGEISLLTEEAGGIPIRYADDVDVARNGLIYFSDASTKFGAKAYGGTYEASLLDLMEHGLYGRLLVYNPDSGETTVLLDKLSFANGVAVSHDQSYVLVNETGAYRVIRYWIEGPQKGRHETFGPIFASFPDNISAGQEGRYWVALVSPRSKPLDSLSDKPFLRKIVQRLPSAIRPKAKPYGHIVALNENGEVIADLQDPDAGYPINTSVTETDRYLYIGSLFTKELGRLPKQNLSL